MATQQQEAGLKEQLTQSIEAQGLKVRQLKSAKADKAEIDQEVQNLLALKKELALLEGADPAKKASKPAKSNFTLKTAKVSDVFDCLLYRSLRMCSMTFRVPKIITTKTWLSVKRYSTPSPRSLRSMVLSLSILPFLNSR